MRQIALVMFLHLLIPSAMCSPLSPPGKGVQPLTELVRYMEAAHYDRDALVQRHRRVRRDAGVGGPLRLDVATHDRVFRLRLLPDSSLFSDDAVLESTRGPLEFDPRRVYSGTLEDDERAIVHGVVTSDGLFDGSVITPTEEFYIEPSSRYSSDDYHPHSIAYRVSDVQNVKTTQPCMSHQVHIKRLKKLREPQDPEDLPSKKSAGYSLPTESVDAKNNQISSEANSNHLKNKQEDSSDKKITHQRRRYKRWLPDLDIELNATIARPVKQQKRITTAAIDPQKTTCMLYLQADHLFFQKFGTEEACIDVMTRHVQKVNAIYKNTDFNEDGKPDNISFMIKRIKVHTQDALKDPYYRFPLNYGVEKFLELFSEEDYDAFCLAYMFTYRDFEMGTLGLAWTGDLKNAGGVCEKNGHYRGSMKSLNTGIVTLLNYGKHVPPAVSHVTLAHEIGHNFGSPHDPDTCTPGGEDGNYIMFARATSGDKKNNNKFSPCSLKSINPVLNSKARSPKGCFTEPQVALCGNGVVEEGEECDCGWGDDCKDTCCFPQRQYPPEDSPPCRLTPNSACSPSQGPCCNTDCQLQFGSKCRDDNGCRDASYCDGRRAQCPPSINKPNKTVCNEEFVCFMGDCTGSICLAYGLESCQCIPGPHDSKTKACELCCKLPGDNQPCLSSFDWNTYPYDIPDMYSKPGTPCNDYNGYCDVFQKCREVDPSGPLATLRKLLLSDESIASFKRWVYDHWYAVLLIIVAIGMLLVVTARLLGKRPDLKKLKQVTIIHSSTTETVRLPPEGTGDVATVHHPTAVRPKLPLKRRVRENATRNTKKQSTSNHKKKRHRKKPAPVQSTAVLESATVTVKQAALEKKQQEKKQQAIEKKKEKMQKIARKVKIQQEKKKKEVIDYSADQGEVAATGLSPIQNQIPNSPTPTTDTDPIGKVKNWLLSSHQAWASAVPRSRSTPAGLAAGTGVSKGVVTNTGGNGGKSRSTGNLKEKMRLQVVYRPPFKLSLKLRKSAAVVAVDGGARRRAAGGGGRRAAVLVSGGEHRKHKQRPPQSGPVVTPPNTVEKTAPPAEEDIDSNIHTVPSDLEVLLSESEFLFSDGA